MTFRMSHKAITKFLNERTTNGEYHTYSIDNRSIHYVQAGDSLKPLVLFVHGSPGSLSAFINFLADTNLSEEALLITTDRPGFGHSNFGVAEPSLQKQAAALKPILEKHSHNRPIILVGHSLAGAVVARLAIDHPELVDGLVLVSASIDPELEPDEMWFRAPLATPFLRWILPRSFRASNDEIYHLKPELEDMAPLWNQIECPVVFVHGEKDSFVPVDNVDFGQRNLAKARVTIIRDEEANHFIPWNKPELIRQAILELLPRQSAAFN